MRVGSQAVSFSVALAGLLTTSAAWADSGALTENQGPRELALGGSLRAGATGSLGISLNPSGLPLNQELVFEGSFGYRGDDQRNVVGVNACDSTTAMPGCFFYQYIGASPEDVTTRRSSRAHVGGLSLSRLIAPQLAVGTTFKYFDYNSDVVGESDVSGVTFDTGITGKLSEVVSLGAVVYNLYGKKSPHFPRALGGGTLIKPVPQLGLSLDGLWDLDADGSTGRYGGGAEYFVAASNGQLGIPLRVGGAYDVASGGKGYFSAGLGVASMKFAFDVAAQKQVSGGDELVITASLRVYGPRLNPTAAQVN